MSIIPKRKNASVLVGSISFGIGFALSAIFLSFAFRNFISGVVERTMNAQQPFIRLLLGLTFTFLLIGISGVIAGFFGSWYLGRRTKVENVKSFAKKNALAFGFTIAILFLPMLFLTSLVAFYSDANALYITQFTRLFGVYGIAYGLLLGITLSIAIARARKVLKLILVTTLGFGLGGIAFGIIIWQYAGGGNPDWFTQRAALVSAFTLFGAIGGAFLGWFLNVPENIVRSSSIKHEIKLIPRKTRLILGIGAVILLGLVVTEFFGKIIIHPASSASVIYSMANNFDEFDCNPDSLNTPARAVYDVINSDRYNPEGREIVFCGNRFDMFHFMPNPGPDYSDDEIRANGGFDTVADMIRTAETEVLFATMQWDEDNNLDSPGNVYAEAVAELYQDIKANPDKYPNGLTVQILTGNMPVMAAFETGDHSWHVLEDLRDAGVTEMSNEDIGWLLEVANYDGSWPHNHSKFVVVDGESTMAAGFNYSYLHFPAAHESGYGIDKNDLGIQITGPVAQYSIATFDDLWEGSEQRVCNLSSKSDLTWGLTCKSNVASVSHHPDVIQFKEAEGADSNAFSLFRTDKHLLGDDAIEAAIRSADGKLDIFEVNFSLEIICDLAIVYQGICSYEENALPFMRAIVDTVESERIPVRIMVENSNMNGLENEVALRVFFDELKERGVDDLVQVKVFDGNMHSKALNVDDELLIVGSQNFHYSAWGESGLTEYSLATDSTQAIEQFDALFQYHWEQGERVDPDNEDLFDNTSSGH